MLASDDEDVPEYAVHQDDKPELDMIGVADESQIRRGRAYSELEARKERLKAVTTFLQKGN